MLKFAISIVQSFCFFIISSIFPFLHADEYNNSYKNNSDIRDCGDDENCIKIKNIRKQQLSLNNDKTIKSINSNNGFSQKQSLKNEKQKTQKQPKQQKEVNKNVRNKTKGNYTGNNVLNTEYLSLDDSKIIALIDRLQGEVKPVKKISVNVKNVGVPNKCIYHEKKSSVVVDKKSETLLKEVKNNLKKNIKQTLIANGINEDLVKYIIKHLKYKEFTLKKHNSLSERKTIDFINNCGISDRIKIGKLYKKVYNHSLSEIEDLFDVDMGIVLTIWGLESLYGSFIGNSNAFEALYSACMNAGDMSRLQYFEKNIFFLAKLIEQGYFDKDVKSSFDGGLGGCQFMPESFYNFAISYKGEKADIINNNEDVFASIANYLHGIGWRYKEGILTEIDVPKNLDSCLIGLNTVKTVAEWKALGIKPSKSNIGKKNMTIDTANASVIVTDQDDDDSKVSSRRAFLVYDNYKVIIGYNSRISYALVAGIIFETLND